MNVNQCRGDGLMLYMPCTNSSRQAIDPSLHGHAHPTRASPRALLCS